MKITINGFILASKPVNSSSPCFFWSEHDQTKWSDDIVFVREMPLSFDLPDNFDFAEHLICQLSKRKQQIQQEANSHIKRLEKKIAAAEGCK